MELENLLALYLPRALSRYFARTEIKRQLQHTRRQLRAQRRARKAGRRSAQPPPDSNHAAQPHN
jgi:hypothetical protein